MTRLIIAGAIALVPLRVFAQTSDSTSASLAPALRSISEPGEGLATQTGNEIRFGGAGYSYAEPGPQGITIQGAKFEGEYIGTRAFAGRARWFAQADVRGILGNVTYNGWCAPWLITPDHSSPNGYDLGVGSYSPCGEAGDQDWYLEGRALFGRDLVGARSALSPYTGVGLRHLSNGTTGTPGYRIDNYLYIPVGLTVHARVAARRVVRAGVEVDVLLHGWQTTHDAALGGGEVPATSVAPAFVIDGFSDVSFAQHQGWAIRANLSYPLTRHWSLDPYYVRWDVGSSPPNSETATFTVAGVTAQEQLGFYEPHNITNEFGLMLGFHF